MANMYRPNISQIGKFINPREYVAVFNKITVYLSLYSSFSNSATATAYWNLAAWYQQRKHSKELRKAGLQINVFCHRWINPSDVTQLTGRKEINYCSDVGRIMGGDWDHRPYQKRSEYLPIEGIKKFEDHLVYRSLREHFCEEVPWEKTDLIQKVYKEIDNGNRCWGSTNRTDVKERCRRFDRLYKIINENGYKTKSELLGINTGERVVNLDKSVQRHGANTGHITRTGYNPIRGFVGIKTNEILIDVGRNGELLFVDGVHRLTIAKLLNVDKIPVTILVRHSNWVQNLKQAIHLNKALNHPDYQPIF